MLLWIVLGLTLNLLVSSFSPSATRTGDVVETTTEEGPEEDSAAASSFQSMVLAGMAVGGAMAGAIWGASNGLSAMTGVSLNTIESGEAIWALADQVYRNVHQS